MRFFCLASSLTTDKAFFAKSLGQDRRVLQFVERVEIFHQFLFLRFLKADDVAFGKFVRVVCDHFIDITG